MHRRLHGTRTADEPPAQLHDRVLVQSRVAGWPCVLSTPELAQVQLQLLQRLVACDIARRIAGRPLRHAQADIRMHPDGMHLHALPHQALCRSWLTRLVFLPAIRKVKAVRGADGQDLAICDARQNGHALL
jgi:hypothetical protein